MPENNPLAYLIDPALLQQQAAGMGAAQELAALPKTAQYANALRQSEAGLPEAQGSGFSWAGPNFMNLLGMMAERRGGRENLRALDSRAEALRAQSQEGMQAENQIKEQLRQQEVAREREKEQTRAGQLDAGAEVFVNKNDPNDKILAARTPNGYVDPTTREPVDLTNYEKQERESESRAFSGVPARDRSKATSAFEKIRKAQNIKELATGFTQEDVDSLNRVGVNTAVKTMTPADFENFVTHNYRNFSPRVRKFLDLTAMLGAEQRHELFGAALTTREGRSAESFIVGANGLNLGSGLSRVDSFVDAQKAVLGGLDDMYGRGYLNKPTVLNYQYSDDFSTTDKGKSSLPKSTGKTEKPKRDLNDLIGEFKQSLGRSEALLKEREELEREM